MISDNPKLTDTILQKTKELMARLEKTPSQTQWFKDLLIGILMATIREIEHLELGFKHSTPMVSWACRNSLELAIITDFVLSKLQNANDFSNDALIDGFEMFSAIGEWMKHRKLDVPIPEPILQTIANLEQAIAKENVKQTGHLRMPSMAKDGAYEEEYKQMNRVTSKLVHPTGFSIMTDFDKDELEFLRPGLHDNGFRYVLQIYNAITNYVGKHGLEPPTN
jgi:hypothetical protein